MATDSKHEIKEKLFDLIVEAIGAGMTVSEFKASAKVSWRLAKEDDIAEDMKEWAKP